MCFCSNEQGSSEGNERPELCAPIAACHCQLLRRGSVDTGGSTTTTAACALALAAGWPFFYCARVVCLVASAGRVAVK